MNITIPLPALPTRKKKKKIRGFKKKFSFIFLKTFHKNVSLYLLRKGRRQCHKRPMNNVCGVGWGGGGGGGGGRKKKRRGGGWVLEKHTHTHNSGIVHPEVRNNNKKPK